MAHLKKTYINSAINWLMGHSLHDTVTTNFAFALKDTWVLPKTSRFIISQ